MNKYKKEMVREKHTRFRERGRDGSKRQKWQMKHDETAFHNLPEGFAPLAVGVSGLSLLSILEDPGPFQHTELHKARRCVCIRSFDVGYIWLPCFIVCGTIICLYLSEICSVPWFAGLILQTAWAL